MTKSTTTKQPPSTNGAKQKLAFGKTFRHWRSGKIYKASDYGHKAWPFAKSK